MNSARAEGAFAASDDGERWSFAGTLTFENAEAVLAAARALPLPTSGIADLSGLVHADSAALAVLMSLRRRAETQGETLDFATVPDTLVSLARVYGVDGLLAV